jgi:eukaryotic-like serine/threonine-protein kinase
VASLLPPPAVRAEDILAPYERVCEIGSRPIPQFAVRHIHPPHPPKLLVAECFPGATSPNDPAAVAFVAEARRISTLASPNVARVRDLIVRGDHLVVCWDFIEGAKLVDLWLSDRLPLGVSLRFILDALSGAAAIHALRATNQTPMLLSHGELSPSTIVVGVDGVARVLHAVARRAPGARHEEASIGYLAPEVLSAGPYDARADVFSAGALLWEVLAETRLFPRESAPEARARPIPVAVVRESVSWAKGLVAVAAKALAQSPDERWPTVAAMAAEIRKVAGLRLASATAAASFAKDAIGATVKARRDRLETAPAPPAVPVVHVPAPLPVPAPA